MKSDNLLGLPVYADENKTELLGQLAELHTEIKPAEPLYNFNFVLSTADTVTYWFILTDGRKLVTQSGWSWHNLNGPVVDQWIEVKDGWDVYYPENAVVQLDDNPCAEMVPEESDWTFAVTSMSEAAFDLPGIRESVVSPCVAMGCVEHNINMSLMDVIMILNDNHTWSRESIADWIETLDIDTTFKVEAGEENDNPD